MISSLKDYIIFRQEKRVFVMIQNASISIAPDKGVLIIVLPKTGMVFGKETFLSLANGRLRIGQQSVWFVNAPLSQDHLFDAIHGNQDITVIEADEEGFEFHTKVKEI